MRAHGRSSAREYTPSIGPQLSGLRQESPGKAQGHRSLRHSPVGEIGPCFDRLPGGSHRDGIAPQMNQAGRDDVARGVGLFFGVARKTCRSSDKASRASQYATRGNATT